MRRDGDQAVAQRALLKQVHGAESMAGAQSELIGIPTPHRSAATWRRCPRVTVVGPHCATRANGKLWASPSAFDLYIADHGWSPTMLGRSDVAARMLSGWHR